MLTKISISLIRFYQHHISPRKGYCCAYRAYTGEDSCSQYAKITIEKNGLFSSFPLINEQFKRCSFAASEIKKERKKKREDSSFSDCGLDAGCECGSQMIPRACSKKRLSSSSSDASACNADSCDIIGDCHPFH